MKVEKAGDIQEKIDHILDILELQHIINARILCMRSFEAKARAYARIWSLPKIWRTALEINPFYIIEVLSENFDHLSQEDQVKILIHELLHIPKKFSGGLVPHNSRGIKIDNRTVNKFYEVYLEKLNQKN